MGFLEIANRWKQSNALNADEKAKLLAMNEEELQDAFYTNVAFGTGGMRGVMGPGTNRINTVMIRKATWGFGKYLLDNEPDAAKKGVVIAHDNRYNGEEYQNACADILTTMGIKVYVFDALRTTPELSYAVRFLGAAGGINITASHNPKQYNGYKIYNSEGNQLILEQSNIVMANIDSVKDELAIEVKPNKALVEVLDNKVDEAFYEMVMSTSLNKDMDKKNIKIVYTPQHGTGYVAVTTVLGRLGYNLIEVKEQCAPLGGFDNTLSPNPEEKKAYNLAIEYAQRENADLICANDPDCDRIGIVVFDEARNPVYMTGNQTAACLIKYLLETRKAQGTLSNNGVIYNTIVSSPLGAKVAASFGVSCEQTLTGFKYIGDKIARALENNGKHFEIGYEESYGYLINPEVRDKDGVQSVMLICEMVSYFKHQGLSLVEVYDNIQKEFGYHIESQVNHYAAGMTGAMKIKQLMETLRKENLEEIAGEKVVIKEDYDSLVRVENGVATHLDYEQSNVLRYVFADGSFVAVRPSGTEPKVKFYFAIADKTPELAQARHDKIAAFMVAYIKD